ncbi:MAG: hypothetical protein NUV74_05355 [Candidatus Brocadiaceae bacterium]|nr:hypothetical protein [Candidatus Brocadiaceae bacterium]
MKLKSTTIVPYSGVLETGSNVSACKHFFPCDEGSGHRLTCRKTGIVWDASDTTVGSNSTNGGKALTWANGRVSSNILTASPPINLLSGAWATFDKTKVWLFMTAGRVLSDVACRIATGDNNALVSEYTGIEKGCGMADGTPAGVGGFHAQLQTISLNDDSLRIDMTVNDSLSKAANLDKDVMTYCIYTPGAGLEYKSLLINDATAVIVADNVVSSAGYVLTAATDFTANPCFRFSGYGLYAFGMFQFATKPANIYAGIYWQAANWMAEKKYIYPGFIGLSG